MALCCVVTQQRSLIPDLNTHVAAKTEVSWLLQATHEAVRERIRCQCFQCDAPPNWFCIDCVHLTHLSFHLVICVSLRFVLLNKTVRRWHLSTRYDTFIFSSAQCSTGRGSGSVTGDSGDVKQRRDDDLQPRLCAICVYIRVAALQIAFCLYFSLFAHTAYLLFCVF